VIPLIIGVKYKKRSIQKFSAKEDWNRGFAASKSLGFASKQQV
jgi:hypothetical protein